MSDHLSFVELGLQCACSGVPTELVEASVTGVKEAVANLTELGTSEPIIKINVVITESGFVGIQDAFAYVDPKKEDESLAGKI